jgi:hypothetical protein
MCLLLVYWNKRREGEECSVTEVTAKLSYTTQEKHGKKCRKEEGQEKKDVEKGEGKGMNTGVEEKRGRMG